MNHILVGSTAAYQHFPDFPRKPKDIDMIGPDVMPEGTDIHWHPDLQALVDTNPGGVASPDVLYTLKISHSFWDVHWEKTMFDIIFFQSKGCKLDYELYQKLYKVWEELHGKKKVNLEATPEEFFNGNIHRIYVHDSIHHSVAYHNRPLFEAILRDDSDVAVDKSKFDALSISDKMNLVREEVYATALERQLIPSDYNGSPRAAYAQAIKALVTRMSKGWFPLFIIENWIELRKPDIDYVARHKQNANRLIPLEK